jgi:hypothetical protein
MSTTTIRPTSGFGRLLGARQLADVVRQVAGSQADWLTRVRLNSAGRALRLAAARASLDQLRQQQDRRPQPARGLGGPLGRG